jgi:hypothetical protein
MVALPGRLADLESSPLLSFSLFFVLLRVLRVLYVSDVGVSCKSLQAKSGMEAGKRQIDCVLV